MQNDTPWKQDLPKVEGSQALMETMLEEIAKPRTSSWEVTKKAGRRATLSWEMLTTGIVFCLLVGWKSQLQLWRLLSYFGVGGFAPVPVSDQAVYDRLERAVEPMQRLCAQVSQWLFDWLAPDEDRRLAPFAKQILALDESTLDSMKRWIADLRDIPIGDPRLLAGRLSGLFDVRRQQWIRLDFLPDAVAHCQRHAREMLTSVKAGTLLLFDLGYFAFPWFDDLTKQGIWWVSRVKNKCSYTVEHVLVQRDGYGECLIFLGAYRSDQTAYLMRLIRIRYRGQWYSYLTNVLDPFTLSGADVVRLYARRWDIELAFRVLKDHLNLRFLWSAKDSVISVQIWATVILAQMLHALQVRVATEAGVDTFDVSLELLLCHIPDFLRQGGDLLSRILDGASALGILRPSTRMRILVPEIRSEEIIPPPIDLVWMRSPRYAHKPGQDGRGNQKTRKKRETGVVDAPPVKTQAT